MILPSVARSTRRAVATTIMAAAVLVAVQPAAPGHAAMRQIAPGGVDSGTCMVSACASMGYAYTQSMPADVIALQPGVYGAQEVPASTKAVTFKANLNATKVRELDNYASNVTFDGLDLDGAMAKNLTFDNHGADSVTFRNGRIGNVTDEKGALIGGTGFTFDNVFFHDVIVTADEVHNECLFVYVAHKLTVRNSRFQNCATMDLFVTWYKSEATPPPAYGEITLENNVFAHSTMPEPGSWHYYSLYVNETGPNGGRFDGWVVRNNTFEIPAAIEARPSTGSRWVGNLGSWDCVAGVSYSRNVGERCSSSDAAVTPASSTRTRTAPYGWVDPAAGDFHLKEGSVAIGKADPRDAPATDRDGKLRDAKPDAGAYEQGPGGTSANAGATGLRLTKVKVRPATICRRPRKRCPGKATLSFELSKAATVTVTAMRRRSGKNVKVRSFSFKALGSRSKVVTTKKMRAGRYRLIIRARDAAGRQSARKVVKLRVR